MAIINISRQPHSSGDSVARELAEKLNYKLVDKYIINQKIKAFHRNFSDELDDIANEKEPGFFKHFFKNPLVYNCLLQAILFEEASNDNVVFKGRGGQYILNEPYVLNIRIVAPFDMRCSRLETEEGINRSVAEKLLEKMDHERANFIQYLFKRDVVDADFYDLVINNKKKVESDVVVSTIIGYFEKTAMQHPLTDNDKDLLKRLALEKSVEATLRKEVSEHVHLKVECEKLGDVKISGFVSDEMERNRVFKLAQSCRGVNSVDNDLGTIRLHKP